MATTSPPRAAASPRPPAAAGPRPAPPSLTPTEAAAKLRADKLLTAAMPLRDWIGALQPLAAEDRRGDKVRAWLLGLSIGGGILAFILLMSELYNAFGAVAVVEVVLIVTLIVKGRDDLANHLRDFVVPLLRVLRQDADEAAPLELSLRLTDRFDKEHRTGKEGSVELFTYPWLVGKLRLRDGAQLEWEISDEARRWSVSKRSSSGKTKTKTKVVVCSDVRVRLGAPKDSYGPQPLPAPTSTQRVQLKTTEKRHVVTAERSIKRKGLAAVELPLQDFLSVVALAYRAVGPQGAAPAGAGAGKEGA